MKRHPLKCAWSNMLARCRRHEDRSFANYGGRGITVCAYLAVSPENIEGLIGKRPEGMTLERIDNDGHYSCGGCVDCKNRSLTKNIRWATRAEQRRNCRDNVNLTINGETRCLKDWAIINGLHVDCVRARYKRGWSQAELFLPAQKRTRPADGQPISEM